MQEQELRELAKEYLVPLFSGAEVAAASEPSTPRHKCVASGGLCRILFKVEPTDPYRLSLNRSQPFDQVSSSRLTEQGVVQAFVDILREISTGLSAPYRNDLLSHLTRRVVAKALAPATAAKIVLAALDQLADWSTRLYEGKPISTAFGFAQDGDGTGGKLADFCSKDFAALLGNGHDTLVVFDANGDLISHEAVDTPAAASFAPFRYAGIASWAVDGRIVLVLNRLGEILAFRDGRLVLARRSAQWHLLTHEPVLTQMGRVDNQGLRLAVYESALDTSFARTGACIGIVTSGNASRWKEVVTSIDDYMQPPSSVKATALNAMLKGRQFQQLDRRLRQELLAIDGSTLVNHRGTILAIGAILKISGGSSSGARLAAAKALAKFGVGIKVSQDGGILGFRGNAPDPVFRIMCEVD